MGAQDRSTRARHESSKRPFGPRGIGCPLVCARETRARASSIRQRRCAGLRTARGYLSMPVKWNQAPRIVLLLAAWAVAAIDRPVSAAGARVGAGAGANDSRAALAARCDELVH